MISLTSPHRTVFHGIAAGPKLALLCAFTVSLFYIESMLFQASAVAAVGLLYCIAGFRFLKTGLRCLFPLWPFFVVLAAWHAITGTPYSGIEIVAKLLAAVGMANLVTMTTRLDDLLDIVRSLTSPFRRTSVRMGGLDLAVALVVRFTPALLQKGQALTLAWKARSLRRPNWRIIAPFALLAIDDAERVAEAIRARGGSQ